MDITNPELQLANDFVKYTDNNIYLTGKAGTGKTTFLHKLKEISPKRMVITAPTGVAAINAGGVTLHSFFQIPFGPFLPGSEAQQQAQLRKFNKDKINIIKSLDLLVIDEISMVRADLLDGVDAVLRRYKHHDRPFGGVQLLMIGDLHQLSPVIKAEEWELLSPYYESGYFFSSNALKQAQFISIELKHIYRQSDERFIALLNRVRDNRLDQQSLAELNSRHIPEFQANDSHNYITLTTHNRFADEINEKHLNSLSSKLFTYQATVEGEFQERNFPTAEALILKEGAQVMFVRNDSSVEKVYFNGKIGKIVKIERQSITVKCPEDDSDIMVERVTWENIKYALDEKTKEISEEVIGSFYQFPLRLAWAITIHKSQGLTFEHAIIDANAAFSHGQVYVALSRCKTFEGMVLSTPITQRAVKTDNTVAKFTQHVSQHLPSVEQLDVARISYQQKLLLECFDFSSLHQDLNKLIRLLRQNMNVIQFSGLEIAEEIQRKTADEITIVSEKFKRQLQSLFVNGSVPEKNEKLQDRVKKASAYFIENLHSGVIIWLNDFSFNTDNKETNKKLKKNINNLSYILTIKTAGLKSCEQGFSINFYLDALVDAEIEFNSQTSTKKSKPDYSYADVEHDELLQSLSAWRARQAEEENLDRYRVIHQSVLIGIASILPDTPSALLKIKGIGEHTVRKYGASLSKIVSEYCQKYKIEPQQFSALEEKTQKPEKKDTKQISYELYQQGLTIKQIAKQRDFVETTIESHLAHYVGLGELDIHDFVSNEQLDQIQKALKDAGSENSSLSLVKASLGENFSYGDIRMVLEYRKGDAADI